MNLQELNELDFNNIGQWPMVVKLILVLIVCVLVGAVGYYVDTEKQLKKLKQVEQKELKLRDEFVEKQSKAANLDAYKKQLEEMKQSFGAMLRQLPNKTEVADLLVDVSQTGLAAGLEFELFKPQGEVPREFYAELPIKIKVNGYYHEFGDFISGLAALPRIVTIHNVNISHRKKRTAGADDGRLILEATAKTYRYMNEEEEQ
ncbi:type 4a pilus biogenesis protein PilO [Candidatus Endoriftia persephone]|uniref:Pilus assembly protein PilO n=3 Tax=Gammaproteobacteria TaxID=1236 RepID=G2FIA8_9GAMM|nr:type 4a pilus biogenesis protein PilO [Candidatus Endoriftia persephone]EGV52889.1 type IV pilus biogenesis protein PilO [endosymbiont of Riftia pachyptila (vent Ph05)]EGW53461.1 pilus assembly protein PilO [endosymbiont of Tevnia jerichonana (vent Tica)]USF87597.1 type 4a pilus biogenesis protein PilO [Candidatus Endoriftia persephone]